MNYPISEHKIISQAELDEKDGRIAALERAMVACAKKRVLLAEENERLQERLTAVYGENERLTKAGERMYTADEVREVNEENRKLTVRLEALEGVVEDAERMATKIDRLELAWETAVNLYPRLESLLEQPHE
jgi:hypothetical protein